jgi:hypothetical protein
VAVRLGLPVFVDLVPLAAVREKMADRDGEAGFVRRRLQGSGFKTRRQGPLPPPPSVVISECWAEKLIGLK